MDGGARALRGGHAARRRAVRMLPAALSVAALLVVQAPGGSEPPGAVRSPAVEPALYAASYRGRRGEAPQWQYRATGLHRVPARVRRAAARITIAVVDTGADLGAPDLEAKSPDLHALAGTDASDADGHGTFVAALAAGSDTNREGIAGAAGRARLLVLRAVDDSGTTTDAVVAAAIREAVDRGARVVNVSLTGATTSELEREAVEYAVSRGVLLVAAAGNEFARGNAPQYPAALLQPEGSNGAGGVGLVVGASTRAGRRAGFSGTGSWISLVAPGGGVLSAAATASSPDRYRRVRLRGSRRGTYATASGTSFAAPQVAGAAALVWAANQALTAQEVARLLKRTARRPARRWTPELGWGVLDAGAAVQVALRGARAGSSR